MKKLLRKVGKNAINCALSYLSSCSETEGKLYVACCSARLENVCFVISFSALKGFIVMFIAF
jgi:hypothetical protein